MHLRCDIDEAESQARRPAGCGSPSIQSCLAGLHRLSGPGRETLVTRVENSSW